jgi:hypothetical protein
MNTLRRPTVEVMTGRKVLLADEQVAIDDKQLVTGLQLSMADHTNKTVDVKKVIASFSDHISWLESLIATGTSWSKTSAKIKFTVQRKK